jgi:hypothetical protein
MGGNPSQESKLPPPNEGFKSVRLIDTRRYLEYLRRIAKDKTTLFLWEKKIPFAANFTICVTSSRKEDLGTLCFDVWGTTVAHCLVLRTEDAHKITDLITQINGA